jgi:hypothetical protein
MIPKLEFGLDKAIFVWTYDTLPAEIKEYMKANNIPEGDLDYIAIVPKIYKDEYIQWLDAPAFGCCAVNRIPIGSRGEEMILGYHA